jgi:penicillin-binding protein 1A
LVRGGRIQGASTITQQLARNMFLTHERTIQRKIKEALLALRIERLHSKHEILEMYFNQIYYGDGSYGVASASRNFFGKFPEELELHEAALLAGLPANPARYSPRRHPEASERRRNHVLKRMYEEKVISSADYRRAAASALGVTPNRFSANHAPYFVEMVRQYMDDKYGSNLLYEGGLRIYTTLTLDLQEAAEASQPIRGDARELFASREQRGCAGQLSLHPGSRGLSRSQYRTPQGPGWGPGLQSVAVQPGRTGAASAGLGVQAIHLHRRHGQRVPPHRRGGRRAGVLHGG